MTRLAEYDWTQNIRLDTKQSQYRVQAIARLRPNFMTESLFNALERPEEATAIAARLLRHYSFELGHNSVDQLLADWAEQFTAAWVLLAVIEAMYQGRYKAISVEQILALWQRRGKPLPHFNRDFEQLVSQKLPRDRTLNSKESVNPTSFPQKQGSFLSRLQELMTPFPALPEPAKQAPLARLTYRHLSDHAPVPFRPQWLTYTSIKQPIQQFIPAIAAVDFHSKLKTIAQTPADPPEQTSVTPDPELE